jgi:hypothetical protein
MDVEKERITKELEELSTKEDDVVQEEFMEFLECHDTSKVSCIVNF